MIGVVLIVILVVLFWILSRRNSRTFYYSPVHSHTKQLEETSKLGRRALSKYVPIPQKGIPSTEIALFDLHPELKSLENSTLEILTGRYKLTTTIPRLRKFLNEILYDLSREREIDHIIADYHPSYSNVLLLEGCRELMFMKLPILSKLLVAQFIATKSMNSQEIEIIYNWIGGIALDTQYESTVRMNAADMLNLSNSKRLMSVAGDALEILRNENPDPIVSPIVLEPPIVQEGTSRTSTISPQGYAQRTHRPIPPRTQQLIIEGLPIPTTIEQQYQILRQFQQENPKQQRTVYSDNQNVHNSEINNSALQAADIIIKEFSPTETLTVDQTIFSKFSNEIKQKIDASLHRVLTDVTTFKGGFTLYSLYQSVLNFIEKNPNKEELNKRLSEELTEMSGLCATGCMTRLVNVIQAFHSENNSNMKIKVSLDEEIFSVVKHRLQKLLQNDPQSEALLEDIIGEKKLVRQFANDQKASIIQELIKDYGGISSGEEIEQSVNRAIDTWLR